MIDTSCQSGRIEWGSTGRKEWVGVTPLGNKMLFAGLVKIMTHQMEHFKEIHTQLSWLSSLFILSLLCFPLAPRLTVTLSFCLPWGISQGSKKAHRGTLIASTLASANTQTDTHRRCTSIYRRTGRWLHLQIPCVNLDLFTWVMFPINIFLCVLAFRCVYMCAYHRLYSVRVCACVCVCLSLCFTAELTFPSVLCPRLELTPPSATDQTDIHTDTNTHRDTHTLTELQHMQTSWTCTVDRCKLCISKMSTIKDLL